MNNSQRKSRAHAQVRAVLARLRDFEEDVEGGISMTEFVAYVVELEQEFGRESSLRHAAELRVKELEAQRDEIRDATREAQARTGVPPEERLS